MFKVHFQGGQLVLSHWRFLIKGLLECAQTIRIRLTAIDGHLKELNDEAETNFMKDPSFFTGDL